MSKALLATTALVAASSLAFAANHGHMPKGQTPAIIKTLKEKAMPGVILNSKGVALGIRAQVKAGSNAHGMPAKHLPASGGYSNFSKSKNALFLSWFGWFASNRAAASGPYSYSYCYSYNSNFTQCLNYAHVSYSFSYKVKQSAAQPFKGVSTASQISAGSERYGGLGGQAKLGIYANKKATSASPCGTPFGYSSSAAASCPGKKVASGTFSTSVSFTGLCCSGLQTVTFSPVTLTAKKQYWVVMSGGSKGNWVVWNGQDSDFTAFPTGEQYKVAGTSHFHEKVTTTRSGHTSVYNNTFSFNTHGWVHINPFSFIEQQAAFSVN